MTQVLTDNRNRTAPEIRHTFEKFGGNMGSAGAVAWMFDRKGIILVDADKIGEDDLMGKALDAGATDMRRAEKVFEITTAPVEMDAVRDALVKAAVPMLEAQVTYVPQSTVRVEAQTAASVVRLIEALEELDDVQSRLRQLRHSRRGPRGHLGCLAFGSWASIPGSSARAGRWSSPAPGASVSSTPASSPPPPICRSTRGCTSSTTPSTSCSPTHAPELLVLEDLYTEYKFPRTALLMAHARGVICLAARQRDVT